MKEKISILGCGWLGMPLASELVNSGFKVKASRRSTHKFNELKSVGVKPYQIDISNLTNACANFLNSNILIIAIPFKNIVDFKKLICQIEKSTIKKVVFISSTSVYPFTNDIVTENTLVKETPLSKIEELFRVNKNFQSTIIRFGGLFGYDRKPGNFIKPTKVIDNPEGYINLIHRDDCVAIIEKIIDKNAWGYILNACADSHPTRREFYTRQARQSNRSMPLFNEKETSQFKIIDSSKLKALLNYSF